MKVSNLVQDKASGEIGIITDCWIGEYQEENVIVSFLANSMQEVYWGVEVPLRLQLITE